MKRRDFLAAGLSVIIASPARADSMTEQRLRLPDDVLGNLSRLRAEPKFVPMSASKTFPLGYVGYLPVEMRPEAEAQLNALIDRITQGIRNTPTKAFVLDEFRKTFPWFETSDTEDRDRFCRYLEDIMDAVGMDSSDGVINDWMYGF